MPDALPTVQSQAPDFTGSLSKWLGIRQQQQALQTGAYAQAEAGAQAQQALQKNAELQKAQAIALQGAASGQFTDAEGNLDRRKMADAISRVAPTYGNEYAGRFLTQANEVVQNQQALQALNDDQRKALGASFASLAQKPDLNFSDFVDEATRQINLNRDPKFQRMVMSNMGHLPQNASPDQLRQIAAQWAQASGGTAQKTPTMVQTGGYQQPGAINTQTGAFTPAGQPIANTLSPESRLPHVLTNAAGQQVYYNPVNPQQTGTVGEAGPGTNPTTATATIQNTKASGISQRVQQAETAANNTVQAQDALSRARSLLDTSSLHTGKGFEWKKDLSNYLAAAGIDTQGADDANTLAKNLARYEAARATQAGLGGTDAARELAHNGSPNTSLDRNALKGIITQSLATEKALAAYANIQTKTRSQAALEKNEADFRSIPNLIQGYEYGLARNQKEAEEFLQKHGISREEMMKTRKAIKEFESR